MKLLDTNIVIYSSVPTYAHIILPLVTDTSNFVSTVTHIETLGYHKITPQQIIYFENLFSIVQVLPIENDVVEQAIKLRQTKKISLGDAIIAATALVFELELLTANTDDFKDINGLSISNPLI